MYEGVLQELIDAFEKLPSIGYKSATRLAFYLLNGKQENIDALVDSLSKLKKDVHFCEMCGNISKDKLCNICKNENRNKNVICVVALAKDIPIIEQTNEYNGVYHVLGGLINPVLGIGPDNIKIKELYKRINNETKEIILALDPNVEGEATTTYLTMGLKAIKVKVSRLASGIPIGSDLEYLDDATISKALESRTEL